MTTSYNGWEASTSKTQIGIDGNAVARGTSIKFPPGVKGGDVEFVLMYLAGEIHRRVEKLGSGCWGYAYRKNRNANNLSCHASGTAIDINAPKHPNGKHGTWTAKQKAEIRKILAECGGVVKWGEDFGGTVDGMHYEIHGNAAAVKKAADHLRAALHKPAPAPAKPVAKPTPSWWTYTLKQGMSNDIHVKGAQYHMHMAVLDGDFGPHTLAAVKHVQAAHGKPQTGVIDAATARLIGG